MKINESQLRKIIKESIKKSLNESCLYCDGQPFYQIHEAARKIRLDFSHVTDEGWEPWDDCDGPDLSYHVYSWAKEVEEQAENWISHLSSNTPINGGEDW